MENATNEAGYPSVKPFRMRFGLRAQVLLCASFLLAIPYLAYQYVWELETYLRVGQEQTMVGTASAVATALHERPQLFNTQSAFLQDVREGRDLYAHKIDSAIRLDGRLNDWSEYTSLMFEYDEKYLLTPNQDYHNESLNFKHMVGQFGQYLYVMFEVTDNNVVYRAANSLDVDKNDFLQIGLSLPGDRFQRFIIAPYESQWVNAYLLDESGRAVTVEKKIQGQWLQTQKGYNVELRLPLAYLNGQIAFAITDVDDADTRAIRYSIGTADPSNAEELGTVLLPSPQIEQIIKGLQYANSRVWVVDNHRRVLARSGDIQKVSGFSQEQAVSSSQNQVSTLPYSSDGSTNWSLNGLWEWFENTILLPVYYQVLTRPPAQFVDELKDAYSLKGKDLDEALEGEASTLWRLSSDNKAVILSAAHPIFLDKKVMGAVLVEQTTNGIRTLRNKALEQLFHFILAIVLVGSFSLLFISSRISNRIRLLRNETESAIDKNGKINGIFEPSNQQDEIGDLSRTFVSVISRLSQYNSYLESMASRISHELRTPVAIVNSSLDLLALDPKADDAEVYVQRAQEGIKRLSMILAKMSEATRLEQSIQQSDYEKFDLSSLLQSCVQAYQITHPQRVFSFKANQEIFMLNGNPELFAQMLDKIISNAVEFSPTGSEVFINLVASSGQASVYISNKGELLPDNMTSELTDSMVSVRSDKYQPTSSADKIEAHLGLGLYLAKMIAEFHGSELKIQNQTDLSGVVVSIKMLDLIV